MHNRFINDGFTSLSDVLKVNTSLVKLRLSFSPLDSSKIIDKLLLICESLKFNNTLTETDIYDYSIFLNYELIFFNHIIIEMLKYNTTLTKLSYLNSMF